MRAVLFLFLMNFVTSCDPPHREDNPYSSNKGTLVDEVTNRAFVQLKMEKGLYPFGTGARMMDQIKMLALAFHYYKEVEIEEARELLLYAGNVFLNIINNNEQIRPYLDNYPFKPENIEITIYLKNTDGSKFAPEKLCVISMVNGVLEYEAKNPETLRLLTICKEPYDQAVSKLGTVLTGKALQGPL